MMIQQLKHYGDAYVVERYLFQCFRALFQSLMERVQDFKHSLNVVFPEIKPVIIIVGTAAEKQKKRNKRIRLKKINSCLLNYSPRSFFKCFVPLLVPQNGYPNEFLRHHNCLLYERTGMLLQIAQDHVSCVTPNNTVAFSGYCQWVDQRLKQEQKLY